MLGPQLDRPVRRWALRLRLIEGVTWGAWGLVAGLALALTLALAARVIPLLMSATLVRWAALLTLLGAASGAAAALLRPRSRHRLARALDRRLALADRLTTALEIATDRLRPTPEMTAAQLTDTQHAVAHADARAALPFRVPHRALLVALALATGLALSLSLPNPQEEVLLRRAAVQTAVEEQIERLESTRDQVAQSEALTEEEREAILQTLDEAIAALEEGEATPEEALAALSQAERELAPLQDPEAGQAQEALEQTARALADSELTRDIAEHLAQGDYAAAAEALAAYAGEEGEALTPEEALELARELAQAAEAVQEADPELAEQLDSAAQAIEQGQLDQAREAIAEAAQGMAETGASAEQQAAIEETLAALQESRGEIAQAGGSPQESGAALSTDGPEAQEGGQGAAPPPDGSSPPSHHEDAGSTSPYGEVSVPRLEGDEGVGVDVGREDGEGPITGEIPLPPSPSDQASVPYREVYAEYADQAHTALDRSYIPLGMKQYVRDYFSSLEP